MAIHSSKHLFGLLGACTLAISVVAHGAGGGVSVQAGNQQVNMTIHNTSGAALAAQWVDFEGKEAGYGSVAPGKSMVFQTYPGHLWRFRSGGRVLGEYRATAAAQQTYSVAKPAAAAASEAPPRAVPVKEPVATPAAQPAGGGTGSKLDAKEKQQLVDYHNQVRREVGVGAVTWDPGIAAFAQEWADKIASSGDFKHRPRSQQKYGENLAGNSSVLAGAKMWYGEKPKYRAGTAFNSGMMDAAHYTQMVWRGSTRIGAGKAVIQKGRYKGLTVLVCNYSPAGNMIGQKPY
jgi:pathogenesis-related protein 1